MHLNKSRYNWLLEDYQAADLGHYFQQAEKKYSSAFLRLCLARGIQSDQALADWLGEDNIVFHDPDLLYDMDRTVDRLRQALTEGQHILIYGDYDADGITSTLILYEALEALGAQVDYYLPNRLTDGYGPNPDRYQEFIDQGIQVILTCDNGVAGFEAIDLAQSQGVDVLVTDHHEIQDHLPDAYSIVHPRHPQGNYPFGDLSGAGVALKLVTALMGEVPEEAVELAAIGTVADMVSLRDENRTIVRQGLDLMKASQRIGLQTILDKNQVDSSKIDSQTIGFIIGPRLNAVGRLGDPSPALELLASFDPDEADELYQVVDRKNQERQDLVQEIMHELEERLKTYSSLPDIIIEAGTNWPAGVVGIVAGRLVQDYHRPAIIFEDQGDTLKGSGRSIEGINLFDWLSQHKDLLKFFGGHSQAAGMTITKDKYADFKEVMGAEDPDRHQKVIGRPNLQVDSQISLEDVTQDFIEEINLLGPFGMDNPEPVFLLEDLGVIENRPVGARKDHLKMVVGQPGKASLQTIGFSLANQARQIPVGSQISLVGSLSLNEWQGRVSNQLMIKDLGVKGPLWQDVRGQRIPKGLFKMDRALYLFDHDRLRQIYTRQLSEGSQAYLYQDLKEPGRILDAGEYDRLVLVEPTDKLDLLTDFYHCQEWGEVYLGVYQEESKYMVGLPNHQEAGRLYKALPHLEGLTSTELIKQVQEGLQLHPLKINLLIRMFLEAKFVTIKSGQLYKVAEPHDKVDLFDLEVYRNYQAAMEAERILTYQPLDLVQKYFEGKYH